MAPVDHEKLLKYLTDDPELAEAEREEIRVAMRERPDSRRQMEGTPSAWDVPEAKKRLFAAIDDSGEHQTAERARIRDRHDRPAKSRRRFLAPILVAATIVCVIGVYALFQVDKPRRIEKQYSTLKGQRSLVTLGSGLAMHLNVESTARVAYDPEASEWDVQLDGEGYFTVDPAAGHAIRVHAGEVSTRVIGTEFSVRSFPEDQGVEVAVMEGRVAVEAAGSTLEVSPGEVGRFVAGVGTLSRQSKEDMSRRLSWREGRLAFSDTPLGEAIPMIERWYDVALRLDAAGFENRRLYGAFDDEKIEDVLDLLSMSMGLSYREEEGAFVLYAR